MLLGVGAEAQESGENPLRLSAHHVTASVADMDKEVAWYESVLGFKRGPTMGDPANEVVVQMTLPGYRIDLVKQKGSMRQHEAQGPYEQGWLHVVFKAPALDAVFKVLKEKGTDVTVMRDAKGGVVHLTLHDPEGNEIGIAPE